jgi:deoxyribonuclease (pyrimidine dimer)
MTRINAGIRPAELVDQHLLAELREIKRIPNVVKQGKAKLDGIPERFSLGTGHVRFFYNKLGYLLRRYRSLRAEAIRRGFQVQDWSGAWEGADPDLMVDWEETPEARAEVQARIQERLSNMRSSTTKPLNQNGHETDI